MFVSFSYEPFWSLQSHEEYIYGVIDENSAAHVSIFLYEALNLKVFLIFFILRIFSFFNSIIFSSEKPWDLACKYNSLFKLFSFNFFSVFTKSAISLINHWSYLEIFAISVLFIPILKACAIIKNLFGIFFFNKLEIFFFFIFFIIGLISKPFKPISRLLIAFKKDSLKFLPIAIHSPIDFIDVPNFSSVSLNFSKVNLGIFVTI